MDSGRNAAIFGSNLKVVISSFGLDILALRFAAFLHEIIIQLRLLHNVTRENDSNLDKQVKNLMVSRNRFVVKSKED